MNLRLKMVFLNLLNKKKKYAIVVYHNPFSSIIQYKPITHNITHNFHSFPNTA